MCDTSPWLDGYDEYCENLKEKKEPTIAELTELLQRKYLETDTIRKLIKKKMDAEG